MSKYIKDKATVIVKNGVPYSLVREAEVTANCPCHICDLREYCDDVDDLYRFFRFCVPANHDDRWFFKKDWEIANNRILDYLEFNPE